MAAVLKIEGKESYIRALSMDAGKPSYTLTGDIQQADRFLSGFDYRGLNEILPERFTVIPVRMHPFMENFLKFI
jgi:hypothetical protein